MGSAGCSGRSPARSSFYGTDAAGHSTGSATLWIPYAGVGVVVLLLAIVFFFAPVPDIKAKDDYAIDEKDEAGKNAPAPAIRKVNRGLSYVLLLGNVGALFGFFGMILWLAFGSLGFGPRLVKVVSALPHPSSLVITADTALLVTIFLGACLAILAAAVWLVGFTKRLSHHSVWSHEHFSGAVLAQFLYVAAQCGIFSFLINYTTSEPPSLPASWLKEGSKLLEVRTAFVGSDFKDMSSLAAKLGTPTDPLSAFLATPKKNEKGEDEVLSSSTLQALAEFKNGTAGETAARVAVMQDLNSLILKKNLYSPERFNGVTLQEGHEETAGPGRQGPK